MGNKTYDTTLDCGCMIAHDSGYPDDIQGDSGVMGCYCQYEKNDEEREKLMKKCTESWQEHYKECVECGGAK